MRKYISSYSVASLVSIITLVVFLPALRNDFVNWDDNRIIVENAHIRSLSLAFFKWAFTDISTSGFWNPPVWISHAVDYALWGLEPAGHHLTNVIMHAINTFVVVMLVFKLLEAARRGGPHPEHRALLIAAGMTGLLFGIHPVHVESVAWVSERKDQLYALFYLLSVIAYLKYGASRESASGSVLANVFPKDRSYLLALILFILSLSSKAMAVTLPATLLILDWFPLNRLRSLRDSAPLVVEKIPFMVCSAAAVVLTLVGQSAIGVLQANKVIPMADRVLTAFRSLIAYLGMIVVPLDLLPFYPFDTTITIGSTKFLVAIIAVCSITAVCMGIARKNRIWLALWAFYVISLLPVLGIVKVGDYSMADRFLYLPSLAPFLLLGIGTAQVWHTVESHQQDSKALKGLIAAVIASVIIVLAFLTVKQIAVWKDSMSLWNYVIERAPRPVPVAYNNRGNVFRAQGLIGRAIDDFTTVISLVGTAAAPYNNRGIAYQDAGRIDEALADFSKAISVQPDHPDSYRFRGALFSELHQTDRALADFKKAIELDPAYVDAYLSRGWIYQGEGRIENALEDYTRAIDADPSRPAGYHYRGMLLQETGHHERAMDDFTTAIQLDPLFAPAYLSRGLAFERVR
jgi:protein O-mannosyl-transferase